MDETRQLPALNKLHNRELFKLLMSDVIATLGLLFLAEPIVTILFLGAGVVTGVDSYIKSSRISNSIEELKPRPTINLGDPDL